MTERRMGGEERKKGGDEGAEGLLTKPSWHLSKRNSLALTCSPISSLCIVNPQNAIVGRRKGPTAHHLPGRRNSIPDAASLSLRPAPPRKGTNPTP